MKLSGLGAAVALAAVLIAACGSDNKAVTTTSVAASGGATTTASASASTTKAGGAGTTACSANNAGSTTAPSFSGDSGNKFCQTARDLQNSDIGNALSGQGGDLKADLQKVRSAFDDLKNSAPSEIKNDVATLATAFQKLDDFWAKYNYDEAQLTAAAAKDPKLLQEATAALTDPAVASATGRITAYAAQVCGIDSGDSTSTSA